MTQQDKLRVFKNFLKHEYKETAFFQFGLYCFDVKNSEVTGVMAIPAKIDGFELKTVYPSQEITRFCYQSNS